MKIYNYIEESNIFVFIVIDASYLHPLGAGSPPPTLFSGDCGYGESGRDRVKLTPPLTGDLLNGGVVGYRASLVGA